MTPGQVIHGFRVEKKTPIEELHAEMLELVHEKTGAQVLHIGNDDPENLFSLSFQTRPYSSNGVAHILEHTVLCGSSKFPVKDPFFAMTRRSLNTFMNAMTGTDFTCYPAASQVPKDFYNLLEVYLDAVFHPNLAEMSFRQEGHRLEFAIHDDPTSPLQYKGVVFNEMKGALASGSSRLSEKLHEALFPDLTYGFNSGGDPKDIPSLTYQQLLDFHATYYHPSHCLFFFYGNMPLSDHLAFINEKALAGVKKIDPLPPIPLQKRFSSPKRIQSTYPIEKDESPSEKTIIGFGWLTCPIAEQEKLLAISILEMILLDTDASPLKKALLKSGLCKQVSSFLDGEMSEVPFVISLKGCEAANADKIEAVIKDTLRSVIKEGFPVDAFENALHQMEIYRSEITGDSHPFGLSLFMRSALLLQHGQDPMKGLTIHSLFDAVRQKNLQDPHYLTGLLSTYLLDNPHFVRIIMEPDPNLEEKEAEEEAHLLKTLKDNLSERQVKDILDDAKKLAKFQQDQKEESLDVLPKISLQDVPSEPRDFPLAIEEIGSIKAFHHSCFTNQIVYTDLYFDLPPLAEEDMPYVRLLSSLIPQMGCGGRSYSENLEFIQAHTGGVGVSLGMNIPTTSPEHFTPTLSFRGKALERKQDKLFQLLNEMVVSIDFSDADRLKEVLLKSHTNLESSLAQSALRYAINVATSGLNLPSKIGNDWYGVHYVSFLKRLITHFDTEKKQLIDKLSSLKETILAGKVPHLVLSCEQDVYDALKTNHFFGLADLSLPKAAPWTCHYPLPKVEWQGKVVSSPVAASCFAVDGISYAHPDAAALSIAANLFDTLVLHPKIREQGGAYGGGAVCQLGSSSFYFYSFRDPHIESTFQAFQEACKTIAEGSFDAADLEEAKLEVIQGLDAPVAPGSRAFRSYSWYRDEKPLSARKAFRHKLLNLDKASVVDAVKNHLAPKMTQGTFVVFAGKQLLEKEAPSLKIIS